jgi:excisionase family DNA binding protein
MNPERMSDPMSALVALLAEELKPTVRDAVRAATAAVLEVREPLPTPRLLSVAQVGERLGCGAETVRRAVKAGRLEAVTSLGHLRFTADAVDRFLARGAS